MKTISAVIALSVLAAVFPAALNSDAIVITRAMLASTISEVFVETDSVVVELEVGVPDFAAFRNLLPDEIYERLGNEPEPWGERLRRFTGENLIVRADGGSPLSGRLVELEVRRRIERDQVTGEPLAVQPDDAEPVVYARLRYPLSGRPERLSIAPPRVVDGENVTANIGFVTYHRGLHVNDFRYLGQEETLVLDWDDPWYSQFENRNLWRQFRSPIATFIYVEPFEVRKEIVVRPRDLQRWVDLGLEENEVITVDEQEEIKRRVVEFLNERSPVTIDGEPAEGVLDRVHFIYRTLRTSGVIQPPRDLDIVSATLGVIFVYPRTELPEEVTMTWELFGDRIDRVPSSATDEAGSLPYFLSPDDNVLRWQNFLTNPTVPGLIEVQEPAQRSGILLIAAVLGAVAAAAVALRLMRGKKRGQAVSRRLTIGAVVAFIIAIIALALWIRASRTTDEDAAVVVGGVLENIYRSFDYRDESTIYDLLARSTAGDLLTDVYLETRRGLELANQGGARARVKEVEVLEATHEPLRGEQGFRSRAKWNVSGSVGHWGHIHQRVNQYEADLTLQVLDGAWKITSLNVLQEERL